MSTKTAMRNLTACVAVLAASATAAAAGQEPCPAAIYAGTLFHSQLGFYPLQPGGTAQGFAEPMELRREPGRAVAPGLGFYSVARSHAPVRLWRRFALDSLGHAFRITGFDTLDLEGIACRLRASPVTSTEDAWRAVYQFAEALAPFRGATYLLGVSAPDVQDHPERAHLLGDSTGFTRPSIQWIQAADAYEGVVTIMWVHERRVHVVEWSFRVTRDGRIAGLRERLLAGEQSVRHLAGARP